MLKIPFTASNSPLRSASRSRRLRRFSHRGDPRLSGRLLTSHGGVCARSSPMPFAQCRRPDQPGSSGLDAQWSEFRSTFEALRVNREFSLRRFLRVA